MAKNINCKISTLHKPTMTGILIGIFALGFWLDSVCGQTQSHEVRMKKEYVPISETIAHCKANGIKLALGAKPMQSELKKTTSLIGMAYLNYIYQNDLNNLHFCESMLLMDSQVPANTDNPYVRLFEIIRAEKTIAILEDIQLSFDYSIARTDPPLEKLKTSIANIETAIK